MSDLGVEEGAPGGKLSHPTVKRGGYPLPAQPHPITERRTFQGASLLQRRPELCSSIPAQLLPAVDSLSLGLSLLF